MPARTRRPAASESIRPTAVTLQVEEPEPEPAPPGTARYRVLVSVDAWTAGEVVEVPPDARLAALVELGYLRTLGD